MHRRRSPFIFALLFLPLSLPLSAQDGAANDLVRRAIANEDRATSGGPLYRYQLQSAKPERTVVKELVETDKGMVARLVSVNGKPRTPEQCAADEKKLDKILHEPDEQ